MPHPSHRARRIRLATTAAGIATVLLIATACGSSKPSTAASPTTTASSGSGGSATTVGGSSTTAGGSSSTTSGASGGGAMATMQADLTKYSAAITSYPSLKPISGTSKLKGKTIWYIPIGSAVPILNAFGVGMQGALAALGMHLHVCDGKFVPTFIASCLSQAATQGADGVVTGYIDYKLVPTSFDNLVAHHIPVLIAGETNDSGKPATPQFAFDDTTATILLIQKLMDESVVVDSKGKAKILFIGVTDSPQTLEGASYSKAFFAQHCPGCTYNEIDYNTASLSRVPSQVSAALISHPDTNYVLAELDAAGASTVSGMTTAGFATKAKMASTNGGLDSLQRIAAGQTQFADVGFSPIFGGWQFTDGIVRMLLGQLPTNLDAVARVFTKDNVKGLTLTPAAYASNQWYGPSTYEKQFTSAWGA